MGYKQKLKDLVASIGGNIQEKSKTCEIANTEKK